MTKLRADYIGEKILIMEVGKTSSTHGE